MTLPYWILVIALAGAVLGLMAELWARWWIRRRTRYCVWSPGMRLELRQELAFAARPFQERRRPVRRC